jgi:hypothetical protein
LVIPEQVDKNGRDKQVCKSENDLVDDKPTDEMGNVETFHHVAG